MELPCVTLHTKDRDGFLNCDGYQGVTDSELETLLTRCREAVLSLEAETEKRQNISRDPPLGIRESCEKLQNSASNVRILGRLDVRDDKLVKAAVEIMMTTQTVRGSKVYQVFLQDILRHCGSPLALLCAASLGKQRAISLNGQDRTALVHYVKCNMASLSSPALDLLAKEYQTLSGIVPPPDHLAERPGKRARSEGWYYISLVNHEECTNYAPFGFSIQQVRCSMLVRTDFKADQQQSSHSPKPEGDSCQIGSGKRRHVEDEEYVRETGPLPAEQTGDSVTGGAKTKQLDMMQTGRRKQEHLIMYKMMLEYL